MSDRAEGRPYNEPTKPGRLDINGVEWWACDPYPTWYRWEASGGVAELHGRGDKGQTAPWADEQVAVSEITLLATLEDGEGGVVLKYNRERGYMSVEMAEDESAIVPHVSKSTWARIVDRLS